MYEPLHRKDPMSPKDSNPFWFVAMFVLFITALLLAGCGGDDQAAVPPPQEPTQPAPTPPAPGQPPAQQQPAPGQPAPNAPTQPPAPPPGTPPTSPPPEPPPPPPPPVVLLFEGRTGFGLVEMRWSYRLDQESIATRRGNLDNAIYRPLFWQGRTESTNPAFLPANDFTVENGTADICVGLCRLGGNREMLLTVHKPAATPPVQVQIAFAIISEGNGLPRAEELTTFRQSVYKHDTERVPVAEIVEGRLSPQEP
jgi:hypothetical protein